jgi:hypothetical protein
MPSDLKNNQNLKRTISVARTRTTSTSEKDGTIHMKGSKTIYTAGRPPWYDSSGQMKEALVIGNFCFFTFILTLLKIMYIYF